MNYLIVGKGWLGTMLKQFLGENATLYHGRIEELVADPVLLTADIVINCAAKTNIDWCEKNKDETLNVNTIQAAELAWACENNDIKHVFISSACIFESASPEDVKYEDSEPNPKCFYAKTKAIAEEVVLENNPESLIIRIRLPLSEKPHPRNTINKLLTYENIGTQQESVTVIEHALPVIKQLIDKNAIGIYHLVNEGTVSPSEIAEAFGHEHKKLSKDELFALLKQQGKCRRVNTFVGSNRIPLLPNIKDYLPSLVETYKKQ